MKLSLKKFCNKFPNIECACVLELKLFLVWLSNQYLYGYLILAVTGTSEPKISNLQTV